MTPDENSVGTPPRRPRQHRDLVVAAVWLLWGAAYLVAAVTSVVRGHAPSATGVFWGFVYVSLGVSIIRPPTRRAVGPMAKSSWLYAITVLHGALLVSFLFTEPAWREEPAFGIVGAVAFISAGSYAAVAMRAEQRRKKIDEGLTDKGRGVGAKRPRLR